jgi:hypothetical protein
MMMNILLTISRTHEFDIALLQMRFLDSVERNDPIFACRLGVCSEVI